MTMDGHVVDLGGIVRHRRALLPLYEVGSDPDELILDREALDAELVEEFKLLMMIR
jgi:hypothetical protein